MKVLMTRRIPGPAMEILEAAGIRVDVYGSERNMPHGELLNLIGGYDGLICLLNDRVDEKVITLGSRLQVIANYAAGVNNIDLAAAKAAGLRVCNTPGVLSDATAELAWALLFAAARSVPQSHNFVLKGRFRGWEPELFLGADIQGKTLGIVGSGRIGTAMALKSRGFDMPLLYTRSENKVVEEFCSGMRASLGELLQRSDFVSIHTPLTDETRHLITMRELELMKPGAILINTGRGPVVKEDDLVCALREGLIAGAGLDVFENEPALSEGLRELPNAVLTPHTGSATRDARSAMAGLVASCIVSVLKEGAADNFLT